MIYQSIRDYTNSKFTINSNFIGIKPTRLGMSKLQALPLIEQVVHEIFNNQNKNKGIANF